MANKELLRKLYLFKELGEKELDIVTATSSMEVHNSGDEIFSQGEKAKAIYLIQNGEVKIQQTTENGDPIEITRLGPGSHFGEMPLLDGEPRSATAATLTRSEVLRIDYEKILNVMADHPAIAIYFYRQFAHFLCGRLRTTTKDLSFSRSKILSHF